jgi:hypothetical protein
MKQNKFKIFSQSAFVFLTLFSALPADAQENNQAPEIIASGGTFTLEKSVVAGGGKPKLASTINETGTTGQTIAGSRSNGGGFSLYSGFWTPENFVPTAATAVVGGRVLTAGGNGIRNAFITITASNGVTQTVQSGAFGAYKFTGIAVGESYVLTVTARKYSFQQSSQIREILDDTQDINFVAAD